MKKIYLFKGFILLPAIVVYQILISKEIEQCIKSDYKRWCEWKGLHPTVINFAMLFAELREFRTIVYKRLGWRKIFLFWLLRPQDHCCLACDNIGPGLIVQHGYSTVVVADRIGKNFHVNQCVNIVWNGDKCCTIGDNVTVCAGAIIVGGVNIGNNVTIGAGTVIVKDVPDNCTVVGNPMRIIKKTYDNKENNK